MPTWVLYSFVPDDPDPLNEICHRFVYRWLIASGKITGNYPAPAQVMNGPTARELMWPSPGGPARVGGQLTVRPGHIIGFWQGGQLWHSMIAVTANNWYGTNNLGSFGVPLGRKLLNLASVAAPTGWVNGNDNQWRTAMGGIVTVTHRLPLARNF